MSAPILYRAARATDAAAIAQGIIQAGDGFLEFALVNVLGQMSLAAWLMPHLSQPEGMFSYRSCDVAVVGDTVVGVVVSFPAERNEAPAEFLAMIPSDRLAALEDFFNAKVPESWYIDTLWVDATYRRRGIGKGLIAQVQARAHAAGRSTLSLMAWASKPGALAFYANQGFASVKPVPVGQHPATPHPEGFVLLQR
ncbi:MAG: GNAT family N-acetyltransferase [Cyanobacteria bacterium P01_G01_bin.54]